MSTGEFTGDSSKYPYAEVQALGVPEHSGADCYVVVQGDLTARVGGREVAYYDTESREWKESK